MPNKKPENKNGFFIAFEGIDGSGQTTQATLLTDYLTRKGYRVVLTKEPTENKIGQLIRSALRKEWHPNPIALQLLFTADRSQHLIDVIEPALKNEKVVICDRYFLSTIAFGSLDADIEYMKKINSMFRQPDITFIINVSPETCMERIQRSRPSTELFEEEKKLRKIREAYLSLKDYLPNTRVIDGEKPIEDVHKEIREIVDKQLQEKQ